MSLSWFSPLPPARTAIAEYAARLLPFLALEADLTLWVEAGETVAAEGLAGRVRRYREDEVDWVDLNRGRMAVYHLGNSAAFHGPIWRTSRLHPGVVVLHDHRLQHLFAGLFRDRWGDREGYLAAMGRLHGVAARAAAEAFWRGDVDTEELAARYPLTGLAVEGALGVLVHSRAAAQALRPLARCPVRRASLPYPAAPDTEERRRRRERLRAEAVPPFRLVLFGHLGPNRRVDELLGALAAFPRRDAFRLDVYGDVLDAEARRRRVAELGLADRVTLHGYVASGELEAALEHAHLAVNLRHPTMGEASLSQLRIWDHALPALVTRQGWYAEAPADTVASVGVEDERRDVHRHLAGFLAHPGRYAEIGRRGRDWLEREHAPPRYVRALLDLVEQARRERAHSAFEPAAARACRLLEDAVGPAARLRERAIRACLPPDGAPPDPDLDLLERAVGGHRQALAASQARARAALSAALDRLPRPPAGR